MNTIKRQSVDSYTLLCFNSGYIRKKIGREGGKERGGRQKRREGGGRKEGEGREEGREGGRRIPGGREEGREGGRERYGRRERGSCASSSCTLKSSRTYFFHCRLCRITFSTYSPKE